MAIIKYRAETKYGTYSEWVYEEIQTPEKVGKLLSREEALKRIEELGMIQVFTSPFGAVYDTPYEPFWEKYEGYFSRKRKWNYQ